MIRLLVNILRLRPILAVRNNTTAAKSFFDLFPKNFPGGGPPQDSFVISPRSLRREYRMLQSEHHPDILIGAASLRNEGSGTTDDEVSSILNRAYTTISNPYTRLAHFIEIHHPDKIDISQDDTSKKLIEKIQSQSEESSLEYKDMLMTVLDAHESLEFANSEDDLDPLSNENNERIQQTEEIIEQLLKQEPLNWDKILLEAIRLKYWVNIQNGIKDWEPGKPVLLTH